MSTEKGEARALLAVRVTVLVPFLWFLLGAAVRKVTEEEWLPIEAFAWPFMAGAIVLTVVYASHRQDIRRSAGNIPSPYVLYRVAAAFFIIANLACLFYSWAATVPAVLCLAILVDSLIKTPARETP